MSVRRKLHEMSTEYQQLFQQKKDLMMVIRKYKYMVKHFHDPKPVVPTPVCQSACRKASIQSEGFESIVRKNERSAERKSDRDASRKSTELSR